jgi:hypothetical protein
MTTSDKLRRDGPVQSFRFADDGDAHVGAVLAEIDVGDAVEQRVVQVAHPRQIVLDHLHLGRPIIQHHGLGFRLFVLLAEPLFVFAQVRQLLFDLANSMGASRPSFSPASRWLTIS